MGDHGPGPCGDEDAIPRPLRHHVAGLREQRAHVDRSGLDVDRGDGLGEDADDLHRPAGGVLDRLDRLLEFGRTEAGPEQFSAFPDHGERVVDLSGDAGGEGCDG